MFANCLRIGCDANEKKLIGANFLLIVIAATYIAIFVMKTKSIFLDGAFNFYISTEGSSIAIYHTKQPFVAVLRGRKDRKIPKKFVDGQVFILEAGHCVVFQAFSNQRRYCT